MALLRPGANTHANNFDQRYVNLVFSTQAGQLNVSTPGSPDHAPPGVYRGRVTLAFQQGGSRELPLEFTVHSGTLDVVDVPAGPWGHTIDLPWEGAEADAWNRDMAAKSLRKLREYGFTTASGLPVIAYRGFQSGRLYSGFVEDLEQTDVGFRWAR